MSKKIFHFTLTPVQSFVAQARRTRDLWAGSFLLSWLAGQAMKDVLMQSGANRIVFPAVGTTDVPENSLLAAILNPNKPDETDKTPVIGSLPNRFKAEVGNDFVPEKPVEAVEEAWRKLCDAVYDEYVREIVQEIAEKQRRKIEDIWRRQIKNFWEINWVLGDDPEDETDGAWLDLRKNWRNRRPKEEGGDHCTIMGDFQELSGYIRRDLNEEKKSLQEAFWKEIRERGEGRKRLTRFEIRDTERLCAIALVKRLFPKLSEDRLTKSIGWVPGGKKSAIGNWPSTAYMAVVPWLRYISDDQSRSEFLADYMRNIRKTLGEKRFRLLASERAVKLPGLGNLRDETLRCKITGIYPDDLDGALLHHHALKNHRSTYLSGTPPEGFRHDPDEGDRKTLVGELEKLYEKTKKTPRSFYALLVMDGDNMGKLLRNADDASAVSRALLRFANAVPEEVKEHDGVTLYAGGDDVLAMLPLDTALDCAEALRQTYCRCFAEEDKNLKDMPDPTISGALLYAHYKIALQDVIGTAHRMLEEEAKEKNGRGSVALAVLKSSGVTAQWLGVWGDEESAFPALRELIRKMSPEDEHDSSEDERENYPRGFFHKLRERYLFLTDEKEAKEVDISPKEILIAEYMKTAGETPSPERAEKAVELLLKACERWQRTGENGKPCPSPHLQLGAGFLARFLSQEED